MKLKYRILVAAVLLAALAGCNPAAKLRLVEAGAPRIASLSSIGGRATVENGGARDVTIESALVTVSYRGRELGAARLTEPLVMPAGETTVVDYRFALEEISLASLGTLSTRVLSNPDDVTVDVEARVRSRQRGRGKKITLRGVPVSRIIHIFGAR